MDVPTLTLIVQFAQLAAQLLLPGRPREEIQDDSEKLAKLVTLLFEELSFLEKAQKNVVEFREAMKLGVRRMRKSNSTRRLQTHFNGVMKWFTIHIEDRIGSDLERRRREMRMLPAVEGLYDTPLGNALVNAANRYLRMVEAVDKLKSIFPSRLQELLIDRTSESYNDFLIEASELLGDVNDFEIEAREALIEVGRLATVLLWEGT